MIKIDYKYLQTRVNHHNKHLQKNFKKYQVSLKNILVKKMYPGKYKKLCNKVVHAKVETF